MAGVQSANHRVILCGDGAELCSVPLAKRSAEQLQRTLVLAFPRAAVSLEKLAKLAAVPCGKGRDGQDKVGAVDAPPPTSCFVLRHGQTGIKSPVG